MKRGSSVITMIIALTVLIFFVVGALNVAQELGSTQGSSATQLTQDVALMVHTLIGTPGDATVKYPGNPQDFTITLSQQIVTVTPVQQPYAERRQRVSLPINHRIEGSVTHEDVCLTKQRKKEVIISIAPC